MARQQSRATIEAEIASLQRKLANLDKAQAERIGKIAVKAGLAGLDLTDAQLTEAFSELARRFRKEGAPEGREQSEPKPEGEGRSERKGNGTSEPDANPSGSSKKAHGGEE
ncbi:TraC family protein [Methylorubrum thiocyanatum]|uniref:TraC family protein n=1 Tax=Methylorubrum thiocyanatum TaxID=47958 RepID=UPI003F7F5C77